MAEYYLHLASSGTVHVPPSKHEIYAYILTWADKDGVRREAPVYWGASFKEARAKGAWITEAIAAGGGDSEISRRLAIEGTDFAYYEQAVMPKPDKKIPANIIEAREANHTISFTA